MRYAPYDPHHGRSSPSAQVDGHTQGPPDINKTQISAKGLLVGITERGSLPIFGKQWIRIVVGSTHLRCH